MATRAPRQRAIKQERAHRTRVEILEAAIKHFARRGILATTMAQLAKEIRMTPGALYWHFPTKEDLLLAAVEELHGRFIQEFVDLLETGRRLAAVDQLDAFLTRTGTFLRYHRDYGIFFGMLSAESADGNGPVAIALRKALGTYVDVVAGIIAHGQHRTSEFRTDVDARAAAHAFMGAHIGAVVHHQLFTDDVGFEAVMGSLRLLLLAGVRAR